MRERKCEREEVRERKERGSERERFKEIAKVNKLIR